MELHTGAVASVSLGKTHTELSTTGIQPRIQNGGFAEIYEKVLSGTRQADLNEHIAGIQNRVLQGEQFSPRELLLLQVSVGRFNMQVELVAKVAESANATLRRLQGS